MLVNQNALRQSPEIKLLSLPKIKNKQKENYTQQIRMDVQLKFNV